MLFHLLKVKSQLQHNTYHSPAIVSIGLIRGGLRVCKALGQCSVQGPRALKYLVGCECVLDALLLL
jgi:hypothetical protein